jgi:cystathionine beta-synthase
MKTSLLDLIGNTPLVRITREDQPALYVKLEYLNPGGSIKDRAALYMIEQAEKIGALQPGGTIIEASSGNQGFAAAMIGAIRGYRTIITVSEKISEEKKKALRALGAELIVCPATPTLDDPRGYYATARRVHESTPGSYMLNQYFNPDNAAAHYYGLGPEIWRQTEGKVTHFFAAAGSGGTVSGAGKYLKEQNSAIVVMAADTSTSYRATKGNPQPYKLEGIGIDYDSPVLYEQYINEFVNVTDEDAIAAIRSVARTKGILIGPSSGAVIHAALSKLDQMTADSVGVILCGDSGKAYLSKDFYWQDAEPTGSQIHQSAEKIYHV